MKNVIMGAAGFAIVLYTIASCLSIYSISIRRNEIENCTAQVLEQDLRCYYGGEKSDSEVAELVKQDLLSQLYSASEPTVEVRGCDMTSGLIAVRVTEKFRLPGGFLKTLVCEKTIVVETEEEVVAEEE